MPQITRFGYQATINTTVTVTLPDPDDGLDGLVGATPQYSSVLVTVINGSGNLFYTGPGRAAAELVDPLPRTNNVRVAPGKTFRVRCDFPGQVVMKFRSDVDTVDVCVEGEVVTR